MDMRVDRTGDGVRRARRTAVKGRHRHLNDKVGQAGGSSEERIRSAWGAIRRAQTPAGIWADRRRVDTGALCQKVALPAALDIGRTRDQRTCADRVAATVRYLVDQESAAR